MPEQTRNNSLGGGKLGQAGQGVMSKGRSVGTCGDPLRPNPEKLLVLCGLPLHLCSSTVHCLNTGSFLFCSLCNSVVALRTASSIENLM